MTASNPNTPKGLEPIQRLDGAKWSDRLRKYFIPQAQSNALYVGDPVVKITGSADVNGVNGVDLAVAGTSNRITGAICGFLGTATAGSGNTPSFYGLGTGPLYRPASTTFDWYALVNDDPEAEWLIQGDNNSAAVIAVTTSAAAAITGTGLPTAVNTPVYFSNSTAGTDLASPLVAGTPYYILAGSVSTSITVAAYPGGPALVMAGAGTGSSFITAGVVAPLTIVGKNANLINGPGSPYTGLSGWMLSTGQTYNSAGSSVAAPTTTGTLQMNIVGIYTDAANGPLNFNQKFICRLNISTETNALAGI